MQALNNFSITAPGFMGVNSQDSLVVMDPKFAMGADNAVIDKYGRIGSRKGWVPVSTTNGDLGTADIKAIGELVDPAGNRTIICAGNGKIFKLVGTTLTQLTYGGGGVAPTISSNNWQMAGLNYGLVLFQEGYDPLIYDTLLSTTTFRRVSEHPTYTGTLGKNNCGISAYGRIWSARSDTDKNTVQWCDTLSHQKWSGGTAGSLNLHGVWPQGGDEIVALAAHNNQLIIFGKRQVLIYTGAKDPSTMVLYDAIGNSGCVGRDTVQNTPHDLVYLSYNGLQSLARTIQEKSAPLVSMSRTVNDDIVAYVESTADTSTIKSAYSPVDNIYVLTFTDSSITFCFDTRTPMQDGSYRATQWLSISPKSYYYSIDNILYLGKPGTIAKYHGYTDNGQSYRMAYYSPWIDFGDPIRTSILKRIVMSIVGVTTQGLTFKWGFDYLGLTHSQAVGTAINVPSGEYSIAEYSIAEYSRNVSVRTISASGRGAGKVIQVGVECQISGYPVSIQRVDIFTKDGAYK